MQCAENDCRVGDVNGINLKFTLDIVLIYIKQGSLIL